MPRGAWVNRTRDSQLAPLVTDRNPEHLNPSPDPNLPPGHTPTWQQSAGLVPTLPDDVVARDADPVLATGWGPVDHTPDDRDYGLGAQPGLTTMQNQDLRGVWHGDDQGTVAATHYVHPKTRDGAPHAAWIDHEPEPVDSMAQVEYQRMGVGAVHDPNAVRGKRLKRWFDRFIDFHRYPVELRPYAPRFAEPTQARDAAADRDHTVSPYPNATAAYSGPSDRFLMPQMRRTPTNWVEGQIGDGSAETVMGVEAGYGLGSWGA